MRRGIFDRGYSRDRVLSLFRFIDWLLALPRESELRVRQAIETIEEEQKMPYITSIERIGREEGRMEGREEGRLEAKREDIRQIVRARFGPVPQGLEDRLSAAHEATLNALLVRAATISAVDQL